MVRARAQRAETGEGLPPGPRRVVRRRLLAWYDGARRDLPWRRRGGDGYAQMVAEVMLQQTQVATVAGYYERFLARFPTARDLAAARLEDVLALWSGLGYYARARHLHAAARRVVEVFGGEVPRTVEALRTLPGIGRYTAGAIASIAYGVRAPILDGNAARVLARLLGVTEDLKASAVQERLWSAAEDVLPRRRCGEFNQALMELGSTVCVPQAPQCLVCPIRGVCRACREGLTDRIPAASRRARVREAAIVCAAVRDANGALLMVQRPAKGLWPGLWELPGEPVAPGETPAVARRRLARRLTGKCRLQSDLLGRVTRLLTHRRVTFHVYRGQAADGGRVGLIAGRPALWVKPDGLSRLGISRACEAVLAMLDGD